MTGDHKGRRRPLIGVMGAGAEASTDCIELAEALGAASRGARRVDGHLVVGVLPGVGDESDRHDTADLDLALFTGIGQARNVVNVLSADVVVVCGAGGAGTASEAAHAIKAHRPLILLAVGPLWQQFFGSLSSDVACVDSVAECCDRIAARLARP